MTKMNAISFETLKTFDRFPRYPDDKALTVPITSVDRATSLNVFVSHCWLQGSRGVHGHVHPDLPSNEKYLLLIEGIEKIRSRHHDKITCCIWMDYCSLNQNENPAEELSPHDWDALMEWSDCLFTPLYDDMPSWSYVETTEGYHLDYKASAWTGGKSAYMNRAWCRLEMAYSACITPQHDIASKFDQSLQYIQDVAGKGYRPHFLYGSRESQLNLPPIILPKMNVNMFLLQYDPSQGYVTISGDTVHIQRNLEHLHQVTKKNVSESILENGARYVGEMKDGKMHGWGKLITKMGSVYQGEFREDELSGIGVYTFSSGDVYRGQFEHSRKSGQGRFTRTSCLDIYDGTWQDDRPTGHGKFIGRDGVVFEADNTGPTKGQCTIKFPNGDEYRGEYKNMKMHGRGRLDFGDGKLLIGYFAHGQFVGTKKPMKTSCALS